MLTLLVIFSNIFGNKLKNLLEGNKPTNDNRIILLYKKKKSRREIKAINFPRNDSNCILFLCFLIDLEGVPHYR